ncbi:MAG: NADH-quinone oxidoreductase subunit N [Thermoanaerobaculia bacterium]
MTGQDLVALSPFWITGAAALAVVLVISFTRSHRAAFGTTVAGILLAAASIGWALPRTPREVAPLLVVDGLALLYAGLLLAATLGVALLAYGYLERRRGGDRGEDPGELYALLLLSTLGGLVLVASHHVASLFVGLELLSVGLFVLVGYFRRDPRGVEAALKYLVLAGASSAFLLFGAALVYAETGALSLPELAAALGPRGGVDGAAGFLLPAGLALILVAVGFKLALVPFHLWTPDVYQGAPAPVSAFVATVSKGAVLALLLRWSTSLTEMGEIWPGAPELLLALVGTLALASMVAGNFLALLQDNVKRILAYSSIAHLGYALVALLAGIASVGRPGVGAELSVEGVTFYLAAYFVSILGAFGVVAVLPGSGGPGSEAETLEDYRGLFWRRPVLAALFSALLLSLAGIPLTAGFVAKFYALAAGVETAMWLLVLVLVGTSALGLFYYLRVVVALFSPAAAEEGPAQGAPGAPRRTLPLQAPSTVALTVVAVLLVWLGTWPAPAIELIRAAAGS